MGKYCCVTKCKGVSADGVPASGKYRFPKDPDERARWCQAIPRDNIPDHPETVVCSLHWPADAEMIKLYGKLRPKHPPSIFLNIPASMIPTPPAPPRSAKVLSSVRNFRPDEFKNFLEGDKIPSYNDLKEKFVSGNFTFDGRFRIVSYVVNNATVIQSTIFEQPSCIPKFSLQVNEDFTFKAFHCGISVTITSLSANRVTILNCFSYIEEALCFLNNREKDRKTTVLLEDISSMSLVYVGERKYTFETIIRSFEYFSTSRSLYLKLCEDYELPSVSTLTRLTSKVNNTSDDNILEQVFNQIDERQKSVSILIDEVYVKPALLYHGGSVFGKAVNKPHLLANTLLAFFLVGQFGGPRFLFRMLPTKELDAEFLHAECQAVIKCIRKAGGNVISILCDNNRTNQKFFRTFKCQPEKPWLTTDGIYLLFDFVHLFKSVRNNWITEKTKELNFVIDGFCKTAKWEEIVELYKREEHNTVKMARLTEVSVFPKPIERQKVSICLKVFSDNVVAALKSLSNTTSDTCLFIELVLRFWKICNVKGSTADVRFNDSDRAPIRLEDDENLKFLLQFADMVENMKSAPGTRVKQLTKDTATSLAHTCRGLVDLCRKMLQTTHQYVLLGVYTTDFLEKAFGKLRQGSGGTYFITCQQALEKLPIQKSKLLLRHNVNPNEFNVESGHNCSSCGFLLDEESSNVFDKLPVLENSLTIEVKETLVYISGFLTRKENDKNVQGTFTYFKKFGAFQNEIDRGKLVIPRDTIVQWVFFAYILFHQITNKVCRKSLTNVFMMISEHYKFDIERKVGVVLSNIFLNNHCHLFSPISSKERKQKVLKLSKEL